MDINNDGRLMCLFSCGAASAVATKIALDTYTDCSKIVIINNKIVEEHQDNQRFLMDCQRWYGRDITVMMNEEFHGSIYAVFEKSNMLKRKSFAPCTQKLKKEMRLKIMEPGDVIVAGFTVEERDRFSRFQDSNPYECRAPLIEENLSKQDCLAILSAQNIDLPAMYKLGYKNNNCIGCVKGGMGYWNKIRVDFPLQFIRMAELEAKLGEGASLFPPEKKGGPRVSLRTLRPDQGRYAAEESTECGIFCEIALSAIVDMVA